VSECVCVFSSFRSQPLKFMLSTGVFHNRGVGLKFEEVLCVNNLKKHVNSFDVGRLIVYL
jgi:hypothetical protein